MKAVKGVLTPLLMAGLAAAAAARPGQAPAPQTIRLRAAPQETPLTDRGFIGVQLTQEGRARIEVVVPGSPAAAAGLAAGDLIVFLNETRIPDAAGVGEALQDLPAGEKIKLTIQRVIEPVLGEAPDDPERGFLGVHLEEGEGPVTVTEVIDDTPAEAAGLQAGDRIVVVGKNELGGLDELLAYLGEVGPGEAARVMVQRKVGITLASRPSENVPFEIEEIEELEPAIEPQAKKKGGGFLGVYLEGEGSVTSVIEGTAAQGIGLRAGDRITHVNGEEVSSSETLIDELRRHSAGSTIKLSFQRTSGNVTQSFHDMKVTLGERPAEMAPPPEALPLPPLEKPAPPKPPRKPAPPAKPDAPRAPGFLGITLGDEAEVTFIFPGSAAEKAGLQVGDWITHVGTTKVESAQAVIDEIGAHQAGDELRLRIRRGEGREFKTSKLRVELGARPEALELPEGIMVLPEPPEPPAMPQLKKKASASDRLKQKMDKLETEHRRKMEELEARHRKQMEKLHRELEKLHEEHSAESEAHDFFLHDSERARIEERVREHVEKDAGHARDLALKAQHEAELQAKKARSQAAKDALLTRERAQKARQAALAQAEKARAMAGKAHRLAPAASDPALAEEVQALREELKALREEVRELLKEHEE